MLIFFGRILFLLKKIECHLCWYFQIDLSFYLCWKSIPFYEEVFNNAEWFTCYTLWLLFLFEYKLVYKSCVTNSQLVNSDLFFSGFCEDWSPFLQYGFDQEEFFEDVVIPVLLAFCIIIIIIMLRHQYGYPWPSLATPPYCPLLLACLQGYILYRHRAAVCRFQLVILSLLVHVKESTGISGFRSLYGILYFVGGQIWSRFAVESALSFSFNWDLRSNI